jgi:hypothetical protein
MGVVTIIAYLVIVIVTTPSLHPYLAIKAAFAMNSIIIFGMTTGVGLQYFISSYRKGLGYYKLDGKASSSITSRRVLTGSATGSSSATAISSFFSFFSLVPLGCCGSWLLILSFLPSIFGSFLSVALIQYSRPFSYIALAVVFGFTALSTFKLHAELKHTKMGVQMPKEVQYLNTRISSHVDRKLGWKIIAASVISIVVIVIVIFGTTTHDAINSSYSNTTNLSGKGNVLLSSPLVTDESNTQKQEQQEQQRQNHIVQLDQIVSGGPPPDGIPSIDNPKFVTVQQHVCIPASCPPAISHKFELTKAISETERFSLSDAIVYTSLAGLYLPTSSALKIWSKYCIKLMFERSLLALLLSPLLRILSL